MKNLKTLFLFFFGIITLSTVACSALFKDYGRAVRSFEVTQAMARFEVDPDLDYYISGSYPNAIMGLHKAYTLDSDLWKKITMNSQDLRTLVSSMTTRASHVSRFVYGSVMFDNMNRQIGIWYSIPDISPVIQMVGERTVIIHTPPIDTYSRYESPSSDE